jgi:mono/diheme cytochrome c family protein
MRSRPHTRLVVASVALLAAGMFWSAISLADDAAAPTPWVAPSRAAKKKNPIKSDATSIASGKALYATQCLKCHGDSGKGDGPSAKDLSPRPKDLCDSTIAAQTDGALFWKITTGRKPMPTFENLISDDDRWNVINYVRTLAPPPADKAGK